ncbi:uncharacterized protein LOC130980488 [Arachis stenosperma]|uniref:uncharacterized protein LOC130980488 n=1 Tax=Arachis stenosperma TaxID=217475 RepID=UPI0025AD0298|nr:uncharacterized protein LOC130980488 [Arachis stenosperma]
MAMVGKRFLQRHCRKRGLNSERAQRNRKRKYNRRRKRRRQRIGVDCKTASTREQHRNRSFVTGGYYIRDLDPEVDRQETPLRFVHPGPASGFGSTKNECHPPKIVPPSSTIKMLVLTNAASKVLGKGEANIAIIRKHVE